MAVCRLPFVTIQHDFQNVLADVQDGTILQEKFWVSCYKQGEPSVHASVHVSKSDADGLVLSPDDGLQFVKGSSSSNYQASCSALGITSRVIRSPRLTENVKPNQPVKIPAFDVSPDGQLIAAGHEDGSVWVRSTTSSGSSTLHHRRIHLDAVTSLKFFPSSQVLLSGSADFSLSVISAIDPSLSAPRTFKGHKRVVTDIAIIDKGRNVLSCSKDGTVGLWDCASGQKIRFLYTKSASPIFKMSLGQRGSSASFPPATTSNSIDPMEVDTSDKLVFSGLQNGSFEIFDLGSKTSVFTSSPSRRSAITAIAYSESQQLLTTGCQNGTVSLYDIRKGFDDPLFSFERNGSCIEDMAFLQTGSIGVATHDGLPFIFSTTANESGEPNVLEELVGYDCDPCRVIRYMPQGTGAGVWCAGDDGAIRKY